MTNFQAHPIINLPLPRERRHGCVPVPLSSRRQFTVVRKKRIVGVILGCLLFAADAAQGDVIELTTGQRIEGVFKHATPSDVVVEVGGQDVTFKREKIRAIYFGAAPRTTETLGAQEALSALKALQSTTNVGVTYGEYLKRVADTKIQIDRSLGGVRRGDAEKLMELAMLSYVRASTVWQAKITLGNASPEFVRKMREREESETCPQVRELLTRTEEQWRRYLARTKEGRELSSLIRPGDSWEFDLMTLAYLVPAFWSCASDEIAEAEKALKARLDQR